MNILNDSQNPSLPKELWHQPPCIVDLPYSVEVRDDWRTVGSGIGNASTSMQTAIGEYFERRHFYIEIIADTSSTLEQALSSAEAKKFIEMFSQTALNDASNAHMESHVFNMNQAVRISDFSKCKIPTVCISLSHYGNSSDNDIYPDRDTCGCSFHNNYESAFLGAIKETLERQFLLKFWLTKQCVGLVDHQEILLELKNSWALHMYKILQNSGKLFIIDISDTHFPGVCLLSVYGANAPNRNVRYCAGMSYAETKLTAIEKSIYELWQTFRYMHLFAELGMDTSQIQDSYLRHFMQCNNYNTFEEITNISISSIATSEIRDQTFSLDGLTQPLKNKNMEGYLYTSPIIVDGNSYVCCKFVSPSLFMHMNNSKNINIYNDYSSSFANIICPSRRIKMVPFP